VADWVLGKIKWITRPTKTPLLLLLLLAHPLIFPAQMPFRGK